MDQKIDPNDYLTPMEAATVIGCSLGTIYNYIKQGKLKKTVILGSTLLDKAEALELRESFKVG